MSMVKDTKAEILRGFGAAINRTQMRGYDHTNMSETEEEALFERLYDECPESREICECAGYEDAILWALNEGVKEGKRQAKEEAEILKSLEDVEVPI